MKTIFSPNDTLTNKISFYHCVLFVVLLPFDEFYSELVLVSFTLHTIISASKKTLATIFRKEVLVLTAIFLLTLMCTIYTADKKEGLNLLSRQAGILLFPVLFSLNRLNLRLYVDRLLIAFAISCTGVVAYLYADALKTIRFNHLALTSLFSPLFLNQNFTEPLNAHATYLSLYVALSFVVFARQGLLAKKTLTKWFYGLSAFLLSLGLIQLGSRSAIISLLLFFCFVYPFFLKGKTRWAYALTALLFASAASALIIHIPTFKTRFITLLQEDLSDKGLDYAVADSRKSRWDVAFDLVKQSPIVGYGSGEEVKLLEEKYYQTKLYDSYLNRLNAHNQYLSFLIMGGVPALLVFLFAVAYGLRTAFRKKDFLFAAFLFLLLIVSVSENILFRNKGIFFYSFFFSLFLLSHSRTRTSKYLSQNKISHSNRKGRIVVSTSTIEQP